MKKSKKEFSRRQLQALPYIATCPTYTQAAEKASVSHKQICEWMQQKAFKDKVRSLQDEVLENAVASLKSATTKAVEVLVSLLDEEDPRTRRGAANDVLNHAAKFKELQELEQRINVLEGSRKT